MKIPKSFPDLNDEKYREVTFGFDDDGYPTAESRTLVLKYKLDVESWFIKRDESINNESEHNNMIMEAKVEEGDYIDANYHGGKRDGFDDASKIIFGDELK